MGGIFPDSDISQLPLYRDGYRAGVDVGLAIALNVITLERNSLADDIVIARTVSPQTGGAGLTLADARLLAVQRRLAANCRQVTL